MRKFLFTAALLLTLVVPGATQEFVGGQTVTVTNETRRSSQALALVHRFDSFAAIGLGQKVDVSAGGVKWLGIQVSGVGGTPTSWTVNFLTSLDNEKFGKTIIHGTADLDGSTLWIATPAPTLYFRSEVEAVVLGPATSLKVTIIGMN